MEYGILGLVILVLNVWALLGIWRSGSSMGGKVIWSLLIFFLPVAGLIIWYFAGPKAA